MPRPVVAGALFVDLVGLTKRLDVRRPKSPAHPRPPVYPPPRPPPCPHPKGGEGRVGGPRANIKTAPTRAASGQARRAPGSGEQRTQPRNYLAVHGVEKTYSGRKVVRGVSLYVRRGEAGGLLGPNGAGKTTVFYMITRLIKADRGRTHLDGYDVTALPIYQRAPLGIGYLPQ